MPSTAKPLTSIAVSKMRAGKESIEVRDGASDGLYLMIYPSGLKSFQMKFRRPSGKLARLTLGRFDPSGIELTGEPIVGQPLTLTAARRLASAIQQRRAAGRDVIAEHHAVGKFQEAVESEFESSRKALAAVTKFVEANPVEFAEHSSLVYFVKMGKSVKIGFTTRIEKRLKSFRGTTADKVALIAALPGDRKLERHFHNYFRRWRISNEFFEAEPVLAFLADAVGQITVARSTAEAA